MVSLVAADADHPPPTAIVAADRQLDGQSEGNSSTSLTFWTRVYFRVAAETKFGERVVVVGGWAGLGNWEPANGLALTTSEAESPVWFSRTPLYLPLKVPIAYRYAILSSDGQSYRWLSIRPDAPELTTETLLPTGYEMTVEDDGGLFRVKQGGKPASSGMQKLGRGMHRSAACQDSQMAFLPNVGADRRISSDGEENSRSVEGGSEPKYSLEFTVLPDGTRTSSVTNTPKMSPWLKPDGACPVDIIEGTDNGLMRRCSPPAVPAQSPSACKDPQLQNPPPNEASARDSLPPSEKAKSEAMDIAQAIHKIKESEECVKWSEYDTVVIVSWELPVRVTRTPLRDCGANVAEGQDGLGCIVSEEAGFKYTLVPTKSSVIPGLHRFRGKFPFRVKFVGHPGISVESELEQEIVSELLEGHDCVGVFPDSRGFEQASSFCHDVLWPLFHNGIGVDAKSQKPFCADGWSEYQSMNKLWSTTAIQQHQGPNDAVWVHDYHLMLVPQFVTRKNRRANIGFFLHIPFPSSEIFRCLPIREEILRGLLCADLVGFHFFEYARHFLVVNKRLLGLDHHLRLGGFLGLEYSGRNVMVKVGHVNVQSEEVRRIVEEDSSLIQESEQIRLNCRGKFIFAAVDRCERLSGLKLKLRGLQTFLNSYPYARGRIVLIQYVYPALGYWEEAKSMQEDIISLVADLNRQFESPNKDEKGPHVILRFGEVTQRDKYALFKAADCLLNTSIRDGLNIHAFEFICCRPDAPATLILSEFTGCARTLASAFRVNPWKEIAIAEAMDKAMTTSRGEISDRFHRDKTYLAHLSMTSWAVDFLNDLRRSRKRNDKVYIQWGLASTYRVMSLGGQFESLSIPDVVSAFSNAKRRVLFLDHEGTLAPDRRQFTTVPGNEMLSAQGSPPSERVKDALAKIVADPNNIVVIMSGRDRTCLENWFGDINGIGLCAEHGFYAKVPAITGSQWHCMSRTEDFAWKTMAWELMSLYVKRTQGSFLENKGSALVFQYRDSDPDFGTWQAKELAGYLEEFMFGYPVTVMAGKGYVEAKLRGVNKGVAVEHVLSELQSIYSAIDFVLCVGDDRSDESMFTVVNELQDLVRQQTHDDSRNRSASCEGVIKAEGAVGDEGVGERSSLFVPRKQQSLVGENDKGLHASIRENLCGNGGSMTRSPLPLGEIESKRLKGGLKKSGRGSNRAMLGVGGCASIEENSQESSAPYFFTVTVGKKPSGARWFVEDTDEISELLDAIRSKMFRNNMESTCVESFADMNFQPGSADGRAEGGDSSMWIGHPNFSDFQASVGL